MKYTTKIVFTIGLIVLISCNNTENNKTVKKELELQKKELELKQKELELKEKEFLQKEAKTAIETEANKNAPISHVSANSSAITKTKETSFQWTSFTLPSTVGKLKSYFGNFSKFNNNELESRYEWKIKNGLILRAFAMPTVTQASNQHQIEQYDISAKNNSVIENLLFGLSLNKTSVQECKQRFNLIMSRDYEGYIGNGLKASYSYKFKQDGIFTYLFFSSNGKLVQIAQCTYDLDLVN